MLADRMSDIEPSGIRRILDLASKMKDPVDFSIGRPDFDIPEPVKEEGILWIKKGFNKYTLTQGIPELIERVKDHLEKDGYLFEDVIITSGIAGGLAMVFLGLVNPGDEVVFADPYFLNYYYMTRLAQGVPRTIDTYPDFHLREEEVLKQIGPRTKMIVINTPNNPTGAVYTSQELEMVARIARERDLLVISDDAYDRFIYDGAPQLFMGQLYEKTVTLKGFSKPWSMTGWRLGYMAGPRELLARMVPLQQYLYSCPPSFAQKAGLVALETDISNHIEDYRRKRDLIYDGLKERFTVTRPEGAFYIFPEAVGGDGQRFSELAMEHNVFVIPGGVFSQRNTHFRISYAVPDEMIIRGVELLNRLA